MDVCELLNRQPTKAVPLSGDDWSRLFELVDSPKLSTGQQREVELLIERLTPSERDMLKLRPTILAEAERCEELVRGEADLRAEEDRLAPAAFQQRLRIDCVFGHVETDIARDDEAVKAHDAVRRRLAEVDGAKTYLGSFYSRWPELFGLPRNDKPVNAFFIYPPAVNDALCRLKIPFQI